jgi:transcriptional regulator with XRE-family HTH domain
VSTIWGIEEQRRGKDVPSLETALRIAFLFGVLLEWFIRTESSVSDHEPPFSFGLAPVPLAARTFSPNYVGTKLRFLRLTHKETLRGLGEQVGRTSPYLTRIENGERNPSFEVAIAICDHYQVSLDYLLWDDDLLDAMVTRVRREQVGKD